jgi:hypothetical protein
MAVSRVRMHVQRHDVVNAGCHRVMVIKAAIDSFATQPAQPAVTLSNLL